MKKNISLIIPFMIVILLAGCTSITKPLNNSSQDNSTTKNNSLSNIEADIFEICANHYYFPYTLVDFNNINNRITLVNFANVNSNEIQAILEWIENCTIDYLNNRSFAPMPTINVTLINNYTNESFSIIKGWPESQKP